MESLRWKEKGVSRIKESPSLKYDTAQRETDVNSKGPLVFFVFFFAFFPPKSLIVNLS